MTNRVYFMIKTKLFSCIYRYILYVYIPNTLIKALIHNIISFGFSEHCIRLMDIYYSAICTAVGNKKKTIISCVVAFLYNINRFQTTIHY